MDIQNYFYDALDDEGKAAMKQWYDDQAAKMLAEQKAKLGKKADSVYKFCWDNGHAYTGAVGGVYTYNITPTSIGEFFSIRNSMTGDVFDLAQFIDY